MLRSQPVIAATFDLWFYNFCLSLSEGCQSHIKIIESIKVMTALPMIKLLRPSEKYNPVSLGCATGKCHLNNSQVLFVSAPRIFHSTFCERPP